jgi:hypothetical protein
VARAREGLANPRFDIIPSDDGFILRVGAVVLCLGREAAEELMGLLADALEPEDRQGIASTPSN